MSTAQIPYTWPAPGQPFTAEHLDQMPDDGRRYEILDGALVAGPEPKPFCQDVAARLADALMTACPDGMFVISGRPVELTATTQLCPDISVARAKHADGSKLTEPPLLVAEIRPREAALTDLDHRKAAYAAAGVGWYWVILPDQRLTGLAAYHLSNGHYQLANRASGDEVFRASQPFPVELRPANLAAGPTDSKPAGAGIGVRR
jgi:Uma2 family endonuclease